jgi:hypothetical protein
MYYYIYITRAFFCLLPWLDNLRAFGVVQVAAILSDGFSRKPLSYSHALCAGPDMYKGSPFTVFDGASVSCNLCVSRSMSSLTAVLSIMCTGTCDAGHGALSADITRDRKATEGGSRASRPAPRVFRACWPACGG